MNARTGADKRDQMSREIRVRRVHDPCTTDDGIRVLVDRVWPRGLRRDTAALDLWAREVAPSTELRKWYGHVPERFAQFESRYRDELATASARATLDRLRTLAEGGVLTLLTATKDPDHGQAAGLAGLLLEAQGPRRIRLPTFRARCGAAESPTPNEPSPCLNRRDAVVPEVDVHAPRTPTMTASASISDASSVTTAETVLRPRSAGTPRSRWRRTPCWRCTSAKNPPISAPSAACSGSITVTSQPIARLSPVSSRDVGQREELLPRDWVLS